MKGNDNGILLEDINSKLDAILEGQAPMASVPNDISSMKADISDIKKDIHTVHAAIRDVSKVDRVQDTKISRHELRLKKIEQKVYI